MIRRSDHVYALLASAKTPEMRARLDLRLTEYATFWSRVQGRQVCGSVLGFGSNSVGAALGMQS